MLRCCSLESGWPSLVYQGRLSWPLETAGSRILSFDSLGGKESEAIASNLDIPMDISLIPCAPYPATVIAVRLGLIYGPGHDAPVGVIFENAFGFFVYA